MALDTLAVEKLFDDVKARFELEAGVGMISCTFGWKEPAKQINQGAQRGNRLVFVPGDPSGSLGKQSGARYPGRNPRPLGNLAELVTVYVWGFDGTAPEDERAQYKAARLLYDAFFRAAYLSLHGAEQFSVQSARWLVDRKERRFGAELEVVCVVSAPQPDVAWEEQDVPSVGIGEYLKDTLDGTSIVEGA